MKNQRSQAKQEGGTGPRSLVPGPRLFFTALQFLTIIPLPFAVRWRDGDLGRSMAFFPLVGLTVGALLAGLDFCLTPFLPRPVVDLLLLVALSAVTGVLHLDGLADVCDGLAARGGRERFLAVMKDSRIGAAGAAGLVLGLLLTYQAWVHLPLAGRREMLMLFPLLARTAQVQLAVGARRARSEGLGAACITDAGFFHLAVAELTALALARLLLGVPGAICWAAAAVFTALCRWWFQRRLGGITGDVIGCVSELNEILCLLMLLAISNWKG